jgi:hypothetical protein
MTFGQIATVAGLVATVIGIGTAIGFSKPWPDREKVDNLAAVVVKNAEEIKTVGAAFRSFALEQRLYQLRRRLWQLMDRGLCNGPAREECRWLRTEIAKLERKR